MFLSPGMTNKEITVAYPYNVLPFYFKRDLDDSDMPGTDINKGTVYVVFIYGTHAKKEALTDQTVYLNSSNAIVLRWEYENTSSSPVVARGEFGPCVNMNH